MLYAHYFASKSQKKLVLSRSPFIGKFDAVEEVQVSSKREARKIAEDHGAQTWNF